MSDLRDVGEDVLWHVCDHFHHINGLDMFMQGMGMFAHICSFIMVHARWQEIYLDVPMFLSKLTTPFVKF